jgi:hypothetical protein
VGYANILKGAPPERMGNGIAPKPRPDTDPEELKKRRMRHAYALRNGLQEQPIDQAFLFGGDFIQKFNPNHDEVGRFASSDDAVFATPDGSKVFHYAADYAAHYTKEDATPEEALSALTPQERERATATFEEVRKKIERGETTDRLYSKTGEEAKSLADFTDARRAKHEEILAGIFKDADKYKPAPGEAPTMKLLGGRGGSGKGSFKNLVYDPNKELVLDADAFKEHLGYDPQMPFLHHEESSMLMKEAVRQARARGLNVVIDGTMNSKPDLMAQSSAEKELETFNKDAHGYKTEAHYMFLPRQESAKRALLRGVNPSKGAPFTGRLIHPQITLDMRHNEKIFDRARKMTSNGWSFWDNQDHPGKQAPTLVKSYNWKPKG